MLDPDIAALVELGDLVAATGLYHQRHGGSVLVARKAIDSAHWALVQSRGSSTAGSQPPPPPPAPTLIVDEQIAAALRDGHKIAAIKRYRELYHTGLKESLEAIEAIQAGKPLPTPERVAPPDDVEAAKPSLQPELDRLILADQKIMAIKHYREVVGVGLKESKDAVEARMATLAAAAPAPALQPELDRLLRANQKIMAIKYYRERTNVGLREAKDAVEARMAELGL